MHSYPTKQLVNQGGVTPIDSIVTAATALSQWSTVNGQTTRIGAVNGQSGVKKTVNVQIPVQTDPAYSAAIRSEPVGGVTHAWSAYFLTYRLADSGCSPNIETPLWEKYLSGQRSMAKISVVNGQTAEESRSKL